MIDLTEARAITVGWRVALTLVALTMFCVWPALEPPMALAAVTSSAPASAGSAATNGSSLEAAASRAGATGRRVAISLIGLAFAVAGIVLAFRRDFKEAAGVFAVGIVAVLLATPAGLSLLQDTVNSLLGGR